MLIHRAMHPYQRRALKFSLENRVSYQTMGLGWGKTLVALLWIKNIKPRGVLVVSPIKVMYNTWPAELKKWTPDLTYAILHGSDKLAELRRDVDVYLTNFESLIWLGTALKKLRKRIPFDAIVIDEGTKIKAHNTKRFKVLRAMSDVFPKGKLILSGTPAPNSLLNLWSQYFFLDQGVRLGKAYGEYQARYFEPLDKNGKLDPTGRTWTIKSGAAPLIHKRIRDITFSLEKEDYVKLPARRDNFIKITLPREIKAQYDKLEKEFFLRLAEDRSIEVFNTSALSMKLRQFVQGAVYTDKEGHFEEIHNEKIEVLKELVETHDGTPVLCAIQFRFELELLRRAFPGVPVIRGGVTNRDATSLINMWNRRELPLLLCNPQSLSHGMNMQTGSNIMVWLGLPWSGEVYEQFIGRLIRQGQESDHVIIHHVIAKATVDVAIAASLRSKAKGQQALLDYLTKYHNGDLDDD